MEREIRRFLKNTEVVGHELIYLKETDSTNNDVKRLAKAGGMDGTVVIAGCQTARPTGTFLPVSTGKGTLSVTSPPAAASGGASDPGDSAGGRSGMPCGKTRLWSAAGPEMAE